ncbi:MAG: hypothetical protein WCH33_09340 [Betaproteobacteria bacterium]
MNDFNTAADLLDEVADMVERHVAGMRKESASRLGLDERCGMLWVDEDCIVAYTGSRLDYYGGFEYIKEGDGRTTLGDYTFYSSTSDRVADAIEALMEFDGECESE